MFKSLHNLRIKFKTEFAVVAKVGEAKMVYLNNKAVIYMLIGCLVDIACPLHVPVFWNIVFVYCYFSSKTFYGQISHQ